MIVSIRKAVDVDVTSILRLMDQLDATGEQRLSLEEGTQILHRIAAYPNYTVYVAEASDTRIVGAFALLVMDNLAHRGAPSAIVEDVCVDESARGQGVGRAMMAFAMDLASQHGCYKLALTSGSARKTAHKFYRSLGFAQHGLSFHVELPASVRGSTGSDMRKD